jgi:hypothetical protein
VAVECVFGDWTFSWTDMPWFVYRAGTGLPLKWIPTERKPVEVHLSDPRTLDVEWMALAAHWGKAHREMLEIILGAPVEMDGFPRASVLP